MISEITRPAVRKPARVSGRDVEQIVDAKLTPRYSRLIFAVAEEAWTIV